MSKSDDRERAEMALEQRIERAKVLLRELQAVLVAHVDGEQVSSTARRLGMSRDRVYWMQRVLGLRSGRIRSGWLTTATGTASVGMGAW